MKQKRLGLVSVILLAIGIVVIKQHRTRITKPNESNHPVVLLVAQLNETDLASDGCAAIIRAVRDAAHRGIPVEELMPDSSSDFIRRYRVLTAPTVLILDRTGHEVARFEGEDSKTVDAVRAELIKLESSAR